MTRTLYVIAKKKKDGTMQGQTLKVAAEKQGHHCVFVNAVEIDYFDLPQLKTGDMLFRVATTKRAAMIEQLMLSEEVGHIYNNNSSNPLVYEKSAFPFLSNMRAGLPVIKTIPLISKDSMDLDRYVSYLSGFPLIVKVVGGSHGVGVMKVDTIEALKSLLDYLRSLDLTIFLRSFVEHKRYARLVVVGDTVAGSHCKYVMENEFRTNAVGNVSENEQPFEPTPEMIEIAVKATHAIGSSFGGVDLLLQEDGAFQIAEVNTPCDFVSTDRISGTDIAGSLVTYLAGASTS